MTASYLLPNTTYERLQAVLYLNGLGGSPSLVGLSPWNCRRNVRTNSCVSGQNSRNTTHENVDVLILRQRFSCSPLKSWEGQFKVWTRISCNFIYFFNIQLSTLQMHTGHIKRVSKTYVRMQPRQTKLNIKCLWVVLYFCSLHIAVCWTLNS